MFPNLSKPQAEALAAFSFGIAKAKSRALSAVARGLTFLGIPDTVETRLRRFISNRDYKSGGWAAAEEPGMESGARGHTVSGDVGGVCMDAVSWRESLPVAEDSSRGGGRESGRGKRVHARTDSVSELVMESLANPVRAEIADRIEGGEKSARQQA